MVNPQFVEEKPLSLVEVKKILTNKEEGEEEMNYLSNKAKEYIDNFVDLSETKKKELHQQLTDLNLVRLREEHLVKIIDFLLSFPLFWPFLSSRPFFLSFQKPFCF